MRRIMLLILSTLCTYNLLAQSINGAIDVCADDCIQYTYIDGEGGPYIWSVDNGTLSANQGAEVTICWDDSLIGTITVFDIATKPPNNVITLSVNIQAALDVDILFPLFPICETLDSVSSADGTQELAPLICKSACTGTTASYSSPLVSNVSYSWLVQGGTVINENNNEIDVVWDTPGQGLIELSVENSLGCKDSISYCIQILEEVEVDISSINGSSNSTNLCLGQTLYLEAISTNAVDFEWSSSDGQFFTGSEIEISFDEAGSYVIQLVGSNACKCTDTTYYNLNLLSNPGPEITCVGTTCTGMEQTYYAADECSVYNWSVSGQGSVEDGGGPGDNYVTVLWNSGPVGTISLSTSGCNNPICQEATIVQIPIIDGDARISGPSVVCSDDRTLFTAPYYTGVDYNWNISGNGYIVEGYGTAQIVVEWEQTPWAEDQATIELYIDNCYLECSSSDTKIIDIRKRFEISGDPKICQDETGYFSAIEGFDSVDCDWSLIAEDGIVVKSETNIGWVSFDFDIPAGIYTLFAESVNNDYCNTEASAIIEVEPKPNAITNIHGPTSICVDQFHTYSVDLISGEYIIQWNIVDGVNNASFYGHEISYKWTSAGPFTLEVLVINEQTQCKSEPFKILLNPVAGSTIDGPAQTCVDQITSYEVLNASTSDLDWEVIPSDAGSITPLSNGMAEVTWHIAGNHIVQADYCGGLMTFNVDVSNEAVLNIVAPDGVCVGELADVNLIVDSGTSIIVLDENYNQVSSVANFMVGPGYYYVDIINDRGCARSESIWIKEYEIPSVSISTPSPTLYCDFIPSINLYALNVNEGFDYQWYLDNSPIGANSDVLNIFQEGVYHVEIIDKKGCKSISNSIEVAVIDCTPSNNPNMCVGIGTIDFNFSSGIFCSEYDFVNQSVGYIPGSLSYYFSDIESGIDNTSSLEDPSHVFTSAGFYLVSLIGLLPNSVPPPDFCLTGVQKLITVPLIADFRHEPSCAESTTQFQEFASFIPGENPVGFEWDFGDAGSLDNTSNLPNPDHLYLYPGNYFVTLTVTAASGCIDRIVKEIIVKPRPEIDFNLPVVQCVDQGIKFFTIDTGNLVTIEWDFGDPSSGAANYSNSFEAIHTFSSSGSYVITLTTENIYGCRYSVVKIFEASLTTLSGDITADKPFPICPNETVTLTAPPGGIVYLWSNGESTQSIIVTEPGIYDVTVTNLDVCDYVADEVFVEHVPDPNFEIWAYNESEPSGFNFPIYDRLEICEGERFSLQTSYFFNYTYQWSNGITSTWQGSGNFIGLPPGTHIFDLEVTDPSTGCVFNADPFEVIINPLPTRPIIVSDQTDPCEGELFTFTVSNPEANVIYYWNNGRIGLQTTAQSPGSYYVVAVNEFGCEKTSNYEYIHPKPRADLVHSGCAEVCFPDTICLPFINNVTSYQWLQDGSPIGGAVGNELIAETAGDYQVILTSNWGCKDTSDVLSLSPLPGQQSVTGNVFFDDDGDGVYSVGEELIENVLVNLFSGNLIVQSDVTDNMGAYEFDPVLNTNLTIKIVGMGLDLDLIQSILEFPIEFKDCVEEKILDFPLYRACVSGNETVVLQTCDGTSVFYESMELFAGDIQLFPYTNVDGCDSLVEVMVEAYPLPQVDLIIGASCMGADNGALEISGFSVTGSMFSIDTDPDFTNNTMISNLTVGTHILNIIDPNGCPSTMPFVVPEQPDLTVDIMTEDSCPESQSGTINISPNGSGSYSYSLDGVTFQVSPIFENLSEGIYNVFVQDEGNCLHEYSAEIMSSIALEVEVETPFIDCETSSVMVSPEIIQSNGELSFSWSTGESTESIEVSNAGIYALTVSDHCSELIFNIDIESESVNLDDLVYRPNVFSPNNDGTNDLFKLYPHPSLEVSDYELLIFDRWGEMIFTADEQTECWDGRFLGREAELGVYVWLVRFNASVCNESELVERKGDVTLVR